MPEGDTIYRAARTLNAALAGRTITRFETVLPHLARVDEDAPLAGRTVESVTAAGKNLLVHFSGDLHLRTHMRMHGSWHVYRPGEKWLIPRRNMRIVIETAAWVAVAFSVPVAEFHDAWSLERQADLAAIGPDFLGEDFDEEEAARRIRAHEHEEIADVLLNQRVVAGIGNEFKSEILFVSRISPFRLVRDLSDDGIALILRTSRKLLLANVRKRGSARRTTGSLDPSKRVWVYGRPGQPCRRCAAPISYAKQGGDARGTYWCPACQTRPRGAAARSCSLYNLPAMPIILPNQLAPQQVRVLQEYRRLNAESLPLATITAIKHPAGGGEAPLAGLIERGFLEADAAKETFALTQKGRDFLAIEAKPDEPPAAARPATAAEHS